jgi:hypothetical protein
LATELKVARERVQEFIKRAEVDQELQDALRADPEATLRTHGIETNTVERLSEEHQAFPMWGCNDFTCWTSRCPESCFVTICGTTLWRF